MKKLITILICITMIIALAACSNNGVSDDYGSFTIGKTYSYDGNYYAVSNENDTMIVVTVYSSDDIEVFSFEPCRRMDYWGICWENDSYNIWVQSGDLGVLCYRMSDEVWTLDYDAVRPDYIISRYDSWLLEDGNGHPTSLETNTTNNDTASYETTAVATESIQIPDYSVGMLDVSLSFDELLVTYMDLYGIDSDEMARDLSIYPQYVSPDSRFVYIEDCQAFLEDSTRPFDTRIDVEEPQLDPIIITLPEYEYHITRSLSLDYFHITEYENDYWAEMCFRSHVDTMIYRGTILDSSSTENGYIFALDDSNPNLVTFYASYYVENYIIHYSIHLGNTNVELYNRYLDRCNELGLPTCDQITD